MERRKTKILATIGPASDSVKVLVSLIQAGVNVFRMNFSHGTHEYHTKTLLNIKEAIKQTGEVVGILQDISGPKIRIGDLPHPVELKKDETLIFSKLALTCSLANDVVTLTLNRPDILKKLSVGEHIYLYDGKVKTTVTAIDDEKVTTKVVNRGILSSNKGVNFPNTKLGIDVLTDKDRKDIIWGIENKVDFMAISFVQSALDIKEVRNYIQEHGGDTQIFAKIEKFDAVENIDAIIKESDGIMVARGDLGIEMPFEEVPVIQKSLIAKANEAAKPVITATQMLLSMTEHDMATRAEISDVANAVLDGTDAVMLSEESAVGINPAHVVRTMTQTIIAAERIYPYGKHEDFTHFDDTDTITQSMTRLAQNLKVESIISLTSSGQSAKKMSRYRVQTPILAVTHDQRVAQTLSIVWGVYALKCVKKDIMHNMLGEVLRNMKEDKTLKDKKTYLAVAGYPAGVPGTTNFMRILKKDEMIHYMDTTYKK
ncbi:MAG: pyruvate kinase [Thiovulaceae bacterium]|nr:pyruvate kinase [Sulfurimonadaceae bacterium]